MTQEPAFYAAEGRGGFLVRPPQAGDARAEGCCGHISSVPSLSAHQSYIQMIRQHPGRTERAPRMTIRPRAE